MTRKQLADEDGEVRELEREDFRRAKPVRELLPGLAASYRRSRGRPRGRTKEVVNLSLDLDLLRAMRRTGRGWQTRANALLRQGMKLPPLDQKAQN